MSKVNQTVDSQAITLGIQSATGTGIKAPQGVGVLSATAAGPPPTCTTAYTATTNDLTGQVIITNTNNTWASGSPIYGTILSNTTGANSVVTVDGWWKCADNTTAATNPGSTANYVILPTQMPFWVMGLTDSTGAVSGTETGTTTGGTEITTNGLGRVIATTLSHTASATTGSIGKTFTYTGAVNQVIGRSFISNSQTAAAASGRGNFAFFVDQLNGTFGYNVASNGDTLQITYTVTFATVP